MRNVVYILEMHVSIGDESPTVVDDIVVTVNICTCHPFLLLQRFHLSSVQFRNAANVQSVRLVPGDLQSKSPVALQYLNGNIKAEQTNLKTCHLRSHYKAVEGTRIAI